MFVQVLQCFALGDPVRVYRPGIYIATAELADDLDALARLKWIKVIEGLPDSRLPLLTPEGARPPLQIRAALE